MGKECLQRMNLKGLDFLRIMIEGDYPDLGLKLILLGVFTFA